MIMVAKIGFYKRRAAQLCGSANQIYEIEKLKSKRNAN